MPRAFTRASGFQASQGQIFLCISSCTATPAFCPRRKRDPGNKGKTPRVMESLPQVAAWIPVPASRQAECKAQGHKVACVSVPGSLCLRSAKARFWITCSKCTAIIRRWSHFTDNACPGNKGRDGLVSSRKPFWNLLRANAPSRCACVCSRLESQEVWARHS